MIPRLAIATLLLLVACDGGGPDRGPIGKADLLGSCQSDDSNFCGEQSDGNCWCDELCDGFGDCCEDKVDVCGCGPDGCEVRSVEVILTDPFCDMCTSDEKAVLLERSPIIKRVIELIDGAQESVDAAQFTFSRRNIEDALVAAHERGVTVRVAMDSAQERDGSLSRRLKDRGVDVRFIKGNDNGSFVGIMHSKFMIVDRSTLLTGSNNWSSTGTSINEENTIVVKATEVDPQVAGFQCHFNAIWDSRPDSSVSCSNEVVAFTPGSPAKNMIRDEIRASKFSVYVLMHHFTFGDLVKELAKAQERGVEVRVIVNVPDRAEHSGSNWDRLIAAGGQLRYKQVNTDAFQLMHNKLVVIDDRVLINGSGNWSGSAFFNNFENYVRYTDLDVVESFSDLYHRLWTWSLTAESLDNGVTAAEQHAGTTRAFFGNLHAHIFAKEGEKLMDDGKPEQRDIDGNVVAMDIPADVAGSARFAYEYARDIGGLDFIALTPHCSDENPADQNSQANMSEDGYNDLWRTAEDISEESAGSFVALGGMEWSTNSTGNHVNILGASRVSKVVRGEFADLYNDYLPTRRQAGDRPLLMFNHPKTFRVNEDELKGSYDQVFGVNLANIEKASERKRKFNDYGLDDFAPLSSELDQWIGGDVLPNEEIVAATLANLAAATAPYVRLIEVTLNRGNEFGDEIARNPSEVEDDGVPGRRVKVGDWDYYLSHGFRLAPAASHDNHFANWGTGHTSRTGVVMTDLSSRRLLTAIHRRSVFASEDENLSVRFYVEDRVTMGSKTATAKDRVSARVLIEDPDYSGPYEVRVVHGRVGGPAGETAQTKTVAANGWVDLILDISDNGEHFFYIEVTETDTNRKAWTAPIWIEAL